MTPQRRFLVPLMAVLTALAGWVVPAGRDGKVLAGPGAVDSGDASTPASSDAAPASVPPQAAMDYLEAHTLPADELALRRAGGDSILLQSGVFDPVTEALPGFAAGRVVTGSEKTFLVQFRRDLTQADRKTLEAAGIRFVDYIPSHAYVVQVSSRDFPRLRSHGLVRWLDSFRGGYKQAIILKSDAWAEALHLDFRLLPGENPVTLFDRL